MTVRSQSLVRIAAGNNAEWCATMSRTHGVIGEFQRGYWAAPARTPPYYPDAVTLQPGADPATLLARIDTATSGASVKDSFADLDLTGYGFRELLSAQWIHRPDSTSATAPDLSWEVVDDPKTLRAWALAWDAGDGNADLFRPELLDDPHTFVLTGQSAVGSVVAGAVASRGDAVVGLSNVFALDGPDAVWPGLLGALHALLPNVPLVGYERGEELAAAIRHGFEPVGPLRIWLRAG